MLAGQMFSRALPCLIKNLRPNTLLPAASGPPLQTQTKRWYTTERANYVQVEQDSNVEGIAWIRLNRPPVNSLNTDMLMELSLAIESVENNDTYRGAILTSANPEIFSAGLDIMELYQKDAAYIRNFWAQLQNMFCEMYGSSLVVISALNGASPAGGCLMALSTDYRIMAEGNYKIGLNEVALGIVAPQWLQDLMVATVGQRKAEEALQLGTMYNPTEAQAVGIIDKVVPLERIEDTAREEMQKWLKIPDMARNMTKQMLRTPAIEKFNNNRENELDLVSMFMASGGIQKSLGRYMEKLAAKSK